MIPPQSLHSYGTVGGSSACQGGTLFPFARPGLLRPALAARQARFSRLPTINMSYGAGLKRRIAREPRII